MNAGGRYRPGGSSCWRPWPPRCSSVPPRPWPGAPPGGCRRGEPGGHRTRVRRQRCHRAAGHVLRPRPRGIHAVRVLRLGDRPLLYSGGTAGLRRSLACDAGQHALTPPGWSSTGPPTRPASTGRSSWNGSTSRPARRGGGLDLRPQRADPRRLRVGRRLGSGGRGGRGQGRRSGPLRRAIPPWRQLLLRHLRPGRPGRAALGRQGPRRAASPPGAGRRRVAVRVPPHHLHRRDPAPDACLRGFLVHSRGGGSAPLSQAPRRTCPPRRSSTSAGTWACRYSPWRRKPT